MVPSISIVEDNPNTAQFLTKAIEKSIDFNFQKWYKTAEAAVKDLAKNPTDLLILDIGLPKMSGVEAVKAIRQFSPDMRIMILSTFEDEATILTAIRNGANGYLVKDIDSALLVAELQVLAAGGAPMTARIANKILTLSIASDDIEGGATLSERERSVINLIALGLSYKDIATDLELSPNTVRRHIENVYKKLNVNSKVQAIRKGRRLGLID